MKYKKLNMDDNYREILDAIADQIRSGKKVGINLEFIEDPNQQLTNTDQVTIGMTAEISGDVLSIAMMVMLLTEQIPGLKDVLKIMFDYTLTTDDNDSGDVKSINDFLNEII